MIVAYPGVEWQPAISIGRPEQIILLAGRIMWTKNIQQAIRAFLMAPPPQPWRLVIAGYVDEKSQIYLRELTEIARHSRIEFHVNPTDADLARLYEKASFCVFTALNEDWGLVPLEAMAHGKCVIANARGGPAESVTDGETGLLVEPTDQAWSEAICRLTSNPELAAYMGVQAHRRMSRYTWKRFAATVDRALEGAIHPGFAQASIDDVAKSAARASTSEDV
jgi:glycosyltransferase involved in cell wall biosynthesis